MKRDPAFLVLVLVLLLALVSAAGRAQAQLPADTGWNAPRALELIQRAQQRRSAANADSGLTSYRSEARIFVYFYLDRPDTGERNLVKTDQLALEVYWQSPDYTKQRIVGWRDEKSLPTNINYHLDHLTVVQENFGDEIRLGDGDEVTGVVHPAAPGAPSVYEYRLVDSLTLRLPGTPDPVRVYELQVRPTDLSSPGFVGSVFVERRAGDIVRMDFTFTESSYVDRYLDYINISLDNGLWQGRYWLPNQQRVEIRRRIPELDIPAGSVIRANMRVGDYRFDEPMPVGFFAGGAVVALPREQRESFPFEEDIHAQVREEGIGPEAELGEIRSLAAELIAGRARGHSPGLRPQLRSVSEVVRYGRAEGVVVGAGVGLEPVPGLQARLRAGWAFGAGHLPASVELSGGTEAVRVDASLYSAHSRDAGIAPAASGTLNTLAALVAGRDYTDPYYVTGATAALSRELGAAWTLELSGRAERHRSARLAADFSFAGELRPVREVDETDMMLGGQLALHRRAPAEASRWTSAGIRMGLGALKPLAGTDAAAGGEALRFLKPQLEVEHGRRWLRGNAELRLSTAAGMAYGELPVQGLYLLGGRGTVPGYDFRSHAGDRYAAGRMVYAADLRAPWLRGRLLAAAGWIGAGEAADAALQRTGLSGSAVVLPSLGVGIGIFHDILHLDIARGLGRNGRWELILEANPGFWDFL